MSLFLDEFEDAINNLHRVINDYSEELSLIGLQPMQMSLSRRELKITPVGVKGVPMTGSAKKVRDLLESRIKSNLKKIETEKRAFERTAQQAVVSARRSKKSYDELKRLIASPLESLAEQA